LESGWGFSRVNLRLKLSVDYSYIVCGDTIDCAKLLWTEVCMKRQYSKAAQQGAKVLAYELAGDHDCWCAGFCRARQAPFYVLLASRVVKKRGPC
jgi:hypothetical protein